MATAIANRDEQEGNPLVVFRNQLENRASEFRMVLPAHITPEKFQRTILTAAQANPDILLAERRSLITACMKAAQDGLLPDGREAALVIFNNRVKGSDNQWRTVKVAQYMPMVYGLRKKILQSGEVRDIQTAVVYRQEIEAGLFIYEEGTERMLRHKPNLDPDFNPTDDDIACAYSVATLMDGSKTFEVMPRRDINKVRQVSKTGAVGMTDRHNNPIPPKGPWADWFSEMARKSVMRRHAKTLPQAGDIIDVEAMDELAASRSAAMTLSSVEPEAPQALPSRDDLAGVGGEELLDEATARALDDEGLAQMDRREPESVREEEPARDPEPRRQRRQAPPAQEEEQQQPSLADTIIAEINLRDNVPDVNSYVSGQRDALLNASPEDRERVAIAQEARIAEIKGQ